MRQVIITDTWSFPSWFLSEERKPINYLHRFTFRKGCINPAIGLVFQIITAIKQQNYILIAYSLPVIIGPTVGAVLAYYAFMKLYKPLL